MPNYEWAVVGAGPAGIATVGKLLDAGIAADKIFWVDPAFRVGDLGEKWQRVPSNTKVKLFKQFLRFCKSFEFAEIPQDLSMSAHNDADTCFLGEVAKPLQWVSDRLRSKVVSEEDWVNHICLEQGAWHLQLEKTKVIAKNAVLALGSEAKYLTYAGIDMIPLSTALDPVKLKAEVKNTSNVAVFGSSHSAVLVLKNLCESGVEHIYNFYRSPIKYAVYLEDRILFDNTGLKGLAADWARENLDGKWPANLTRHIANAENIQKYLTQCDKVIYAVGFEPRSLDAVGVDLSKYNDKYGIVAPGLFGIGIAFPEGKYDPFFNFEYNVGLWKFMDYLNRVLPIWMKYSC